MPVTQTRLFDPAVYDSSVFDTRTNYLVTLAESRQVFDEAIFDAAIFDTNRGGVIDTTDSVAKQLSSQRALSESISSGETLARILASVRSITAPGISLSDSVGRVYNSLRTLTESSSFTDLVTTITPSVIRYLFDKGRMFDNTMFDNAVFDTDIKTNEITDSVARNLSLIHI